MVDIPLISGVRELAGAYDGFILDLWGVLHNGQTPYPGTVDCLARLRAAGKKLAILSNAPRRAESVRRRIAEIGFAPDSYDSLLSSGEDAWLELSRRGQQDADPFYAALGARCFHLGPDWDKGILRGLPIENAASVEAADFVLCTGVLDRGHRLEPYEAQLRQMAARKLPMVCANPDLVVVHNARLEYCAGSLAKRYEELGGQVRYHGKPHAPVYGRVLGQLGIADRGRILAVGDSLRTDMAGAKAAGIPSLLVIGGIHEDEFAGDPAKISAACAKAGLRPRAAIAGFHW